MKCMQARRNLERPSHSLSTVRRALHITQYSVLRCCIFSGTQVWLSGTIYPLQGNPPWVATFAVDGNTPVVLTGPDAPSQQFNTSFWASPQLADNQQHKIVVQVASATQNAPFLFDQLLYSPSNPSPTTTESAVVYASTTPPQVTVTVSAMPEAKAGAPVGAIVGGIVAGVVVLAVAGILVFYFWRRRQNDRPYHYNSVNSGDLSKGETSEGELSRLQSEIIC